jgi:cyclopropane-fatty-acyl-phospholipid synthase
MKADIIPAEAPALKALREQPLDRFARRFLIALLEKMTRGQLTFIEKEDAYVFGQLSAACSLRATVSIHHPRFYTRTLLGGTIGAAEAYMEGLWSSDDLTTVVRILVLNQSLFAEMEKGWAWLTTPFHRAYHFFRRNTPAGSRANIVAHYDLGNDFYELFLDETLTYSCGIFERENSSPAEASLAKYRRICQKLELTPEDHVVEIGAGWGGFALFAAQHYGCRVTTTTISREQYKRAGERIQAAGLTNRITLLNKDYRDLTGRFDKLVSIEMIEAVGHHYFDTFFATCSRLLKEDGMMAIQAITIRDQVFEQHNPTTIFMRF